MRRETKAQRIERAKRDERDLVPFCERRKRDWLVGCKVQDPDGGWPYHAPMGIVSGNETWVYVDSGDESIMLRRASLPALIQALQEFEQEHPLVTAV